MNLTKCWHIKTAVYDLDVLAKDKPDIRLIKKSILKLGYRAFFVNDRSEVEESEWYRNYLLGGNGLFYVEGSGVYRLANIDLTDNELYFEKDNLPTGFKPWIFYSWQSDYNPSRTSIKSGLEAAIEEINQNRSPKATLEIVESTRPADGADDIVSTIKRNLDRCLLAVFDITNTSIVPNGEGKPSKAYPNANVVFEMSYALQRKRKDQIILVKRTRDDVAVDGVPFDFSQNRYLEYKTKGQARDCIKAIIVQNLEILGFIG